MCSSRRPLVWRFVPGDGARGEVSGFLAQGQRVTVMDRQRRS